MHGKRDEILGFELGWDYAMYGVYPPVDDAMDVCRSVTNGYAAGKSHFESSHHKSRHGETEFKYRKKWLNLRLSAFKRSRILSEDVTPEYLKSIHGQVCPVTRAPYTYGLGLPTDVTIERINNNGGYAAGNICTLSAVANQAKGSHSFSEVLDLAAGVAGGSMHAGLNKLEWFRLACLSSYGCSPDEQAIADGLPMLCCPLPGCSLGSKVMAMKFATSHLVLPMHKRPVIDFIHRAYKSLGDKKVNRMLEKFYENGKGAYNRAYHLSDARSPLFLIEDCWQNPVLVNSWASLVKAVGDRFPEISACIYPLANKRFVDQDTIDTRSWGLESRGYLTGFRSSTLEELPALDF